MKLQKDWGGYDMTEKERLEKIKELHSNRIAQNELYSARFLDVEWLIEQTEKYQKIKQSWENEQNSNALFFLRTCKEVIEDMEIPKRKKRI